MTQQRATWVGTTERAVDGWRVVVHWHDVDGRIVPAGVEVRSYDVPHDEPLTEDPAPRDGTVEADHSLGRFPREVLPREVTASSGLMGHRIKWGDEIRVQLGQLVESLGRSAEEDPRGLGAWADDAAVRAERGGRRAPRATSETYGWVAALDQETANDPASRGREALAVLRLLRDRHGLELDEENASDRSKVRAWLKIARDSYRPNTTTSSNTERKGSK